MVCNKLETYVLLWSKSNVKLMFIDTWIIYLFFDILSAIQIGNGHYNNQKSALMNDRWLKGVACKFALFRWI